MKKVVSALYVLLITATLGKAQDHLYSQFYGAPVYLNPALNGQFQGDIRLSLIHRRQWADIPGPLNYFTLTADYNVPRFGGGFGLIASSSSEGTAWLRKLNLGGIYSYSVTFSEAVLSFGIQAGFTRRSIDSEKLIFGDQLDRNGIIPGAPTDASVLQYNNRFFFDTGAGVNLVIGNLMAGTSAQHLNRPDESFTGTRAPLPIRVNGHISYRLATDYYNDENSPLFIPSVLIYHQAGSSNISAGAQYKNKKINIGLWYRKDGREGSSAVLSLIFDIFDRHDYNDKVRLGLSHDAPVSGLSYGKTDGSTEAAVTWETSLNSRTGRIGNPHFSNYGKRCYDFY